MDSEDNIQLPIIAVNMIMFKSSQTAAEIGLLMDKSARNIQFKDVVAHMDGLHSWAKGLITLTLWVTNPVSLITHHLACMDGERENKGKIWANTPVLLNANLNQKKKLRRIYLKLS